MAHLQVRCQGFFDDRNMDNLKLSISENRKWKLLDVLEHSIHIFIK